VPIDHVKLPVSDLDASRAFYAAALAPFGHVLVYDGESLGFGRGDGGEEDEPFAVELTAAPSVPSHVAFTSSSLEQVDAFYAAAVAAGGTDNGPPGERPYGGYYYAAFVRDPDGHNIEAVYHGPASRREPAPADRATD
jgi:catechol 2,3-dioxygenase-like lactoylglutathione lyase family enzyme